MVRFGVMRTRRGVGALFGLGPLVAIAALAHCGGGVREDAAGSDSGVSDAALDADARDAFDAAPAQCIPDGGQIRLNHPELVEGPCTSDCPNGAACVALNLIDDAYDGSFCVHVPHPCLAFACPSCTQCAVSDIGGVAMQPGCVPEPGPESVVSRPDLIFGTCRTTADCPDGETCSDLSQIDPSYSSLRCTRPRISPCQLVWCAIGTECTCQSARGTACTTSDSDPVRIACR